MPILAKKGTRAVRYQIKDNIDIVALYLEGKKALAVEVKRQPEKFRPEVLHKRVQHLKDKVLDDYAVKEKCLSLRDM